MSERMKDFRGRYNQLCSEGQICPLKSVGKKLKGNEFCTAVEAIRYEHWEFVLKALSIDNSLTKVQFVSVLTPADYALVNGKKKKVRDLPIPYGRTAGNISAICKAVSSLLSISQTLRQLKLENLMMRPEDADCLSEGLKNANLVYFSLAGCRLGDDFIERLCRGLHVSKIDWIDLSSCRLSMRSITSLSNVIKSHNIRRHNEMFKDTLRQQLPSLDAQKGLKRVSLNDNLLCDKGINILTESLADDLWIKALDLQKCGVGNEGAMKLLQIAKVSPQIQIIDLRLNEVDEYILERLYQQLELNKAGKILEAAKHSTVRKSNKYENKRDGSAPVSADDTNKETDGASQNPNDMEDLKKLNGNLLKDIIKLKKAYNSERKMHLYFKNLLIKSQAENHNLRKTLIEMTNPENQIIIDQETFLLVQNTFEKLENFLHAMKEHGLWDYVQMYGVDGAADVVLETNSDSRKCMKVIEKSSQSANSTSKSDNSNHFQNKHASSYRCQKANLAQGRNSFEEVQNVTDAHPEQKLTEKPVSQAKTRSQFAHKAAVQRLYKEAFEHYSNKSSNPHACCTKPSVHRTDGLPASVPGKAQRLHLHFAKLPVDSKIPVPPKDFVPTPHDNKFEEIYDTKHADHEVEDKNEIISAKPNYPDFNELHFPSKPDKIPKAASLKDRDSSFSSSWAKQRKLKRKHMKEIIDSSSSSSSDHENSSARSEIKLSVKPKQHSTMKPCRQSKQDLKVKNQTSSSDSVSDKSASTDLSAHNHSHSSSFPERDVSKPESAASKTFENESSSQTITDFHVLADEKVEVVMSSVSSEESLFKNPSDDKAGPNLNLQNAMNVSSKSSLKKMSIKKFGKKSSSSSSSSKEEAPRSYFESVSDASTDKDVKSISEMEVSLDSSAKVKYSDEFTNLHTNVFSERIQKENLSEISACAKYSGDNCKKVS
ncbi:Centrosomal protein, partial [Stegodyphus mimosarum]